MKIKIILYRIRSNKHNHGKKRVCIYILEKKLVWTEETNGKWVYPEI